MENIRKKDFPKISKPKEVQPQTDNVGMRISRGKTFSEIM